MMCANTGKEPAEATSEAKPGPQSGWRRVAARLPRLELVLLVLAFLSNQFGKYRVLRRWQPDDIYTGLVDVSLSDGMFFAMVAVVIFAGYAAAPGKTTTRLAILVSLLVAGWSAANMAWMVGTGVQVHIAIVTHLFRDPAEFGPIVFKSLVGRPKFFIPIVTLGPLLAILVGWQIFKPRTPKLPRRKCMSAALAALAIAAVLFGFNAAYRSARNSNPLRAALAFNSHWFALTSLSGVTGTLAEAEEIGERRVPRIGERKLTPPQKSNRQPHVVMIVLESVAHWATSLAGKPEEATPAIAALAREGVVFENTRTIVTHTTQSQFCMLTGATPSLGGGFVEATLVDEPYESLATILGRAGYRSRFSQMVRATFESNPSLVANLGFDSFWAREDNGNEDDHLGYFSGDDFKMIEPAFEWFDQQEDPCLMLFMSSVAHHPYEVPSWYGPEIKDHLKAFAQTVRFTDDWVTAILDNLRKRGVYDDTLVCLVSDHGEGFGKYGIFQHGENPYDESLRIPWIISWPAKIKQPRAVKGLCSNVDVTPTLLSMLGYDISEAEFDGLNALDPIPPDRMIRFSGWDLVDPAGTIQSNRKVVYWPIPDNIAYAYDLASDPTEMNPAELTGKAASKVRDDIMNWRRRSIIKFDPQRYREAFLFDRWQTASLGDTAWCYYVPASSEGQP